MLVDDEPEICEGLQKVVDLEQLGFSVVGEARNGMEALEIAETAHPDIVITDIRMPVLDGLSMAAAMKKMLPTVRFIILSGYDEFEFARKAIELTALRYLLKPISSKEIVAVLREVKVLLDEEFTKAHDIERLRASFSQSLPLLREALLSSLITGNRGVESIKDAAIRYGMALEAEAYALALLRLPPGRDSAPGQFDGEPDLLAFAAQNIAAEIAENHLRGEWFHYGSMLAVLLMPDEGGPHGFSQIVDCLEEIRVSIAHFLQISVDIGVSAIAGTLAALPGCASQAQFALSQSAHDGEGKLVCYSDIVPEGRAETPLRPDEHLLRALSDNLRLCNVPLCESILQNILEPCLKQGAPEAAYRFFMLEIVMVFFRAAQDNELSPPDAEFAKALDELMQCPPPRRAKELFSLFLHSFSRAISDRRTTVSQQLAREAIAYIGERYGEEDLTIEKVCRHLHISSSYFCSLFKKETQKTFLQFLTELRMEKAMALLARGHLKTSEIARQVGISDPSYFGYIFRRHFGIPPSQAKRIAESSP